MTSDLVPASAAILRSGYDGLLTDLDGVVYVGPHAVPAAVEALTAAAADGLTVGYVTNNASRPPEVVAAQLRAFGLALDDSAVVTSAQIGAGLVYKRFGAGARVLPVGGVGVGLALERAGLQLVESAADVPVAVMQGYGPDVDWHQLAEACFAIQAGAHWVATNTDLTLPLPRGIAPGNGTLVAAVRAAVGIEPEVAGKPQAVAMQDAARRLGASRPLVLGDRLDTDIEGANAAGFDSLLVLTGVHGFRELVDAPAHRRPTFIATTLAALERPAPVVTVEDGAATCGGATVVASDRALTLVAGNERAEAMAAALALIWKGGPATLDGPLAALVDGAVRPAE